MKKVIYVILAVVVLVAVIALLNVYNDYRTYTVGKDPKLSDIRRVHIMSSEYSSDYGYIYDLYSAGYRKGGYYAETDLYDKKEKKQLWSGGLVVGTILAVASSLQQYGVNVTTAAKAGFMKF